MICPDRRSLMIIAVSAFLMLARFSYAQEPFKIYLVGDAGDHEEAGETLVNLRKELLAHPNSAVIFLGDNSYKDALGGIIPFGFKGFDSSRNTIEKLKSQLDLAEQYKGFVFFTPGNHDWWNKTTFEKGRGKLAMEESFLETNSKLNTSIANPGKLFFPSGGGYGPDYVELYHNTVRLVFLDTYRIIQTGIKKEKIPEEEKSVYHKLDSIIAEGYRLKQRVIVVAHHPVYSAGPYNRVLRNPYLFRRIKASNASFPSYKAMADSIRKVLKHYPGIYYVSGHIHALQYFYTADSIHYIISGAGSKENKMSVKEINKYNALLLPNEYLLWNSGGFFELECTADEVHTILYYQDGTLKCTLP
jgi:hypothetical protein